MTGAKFVGIFLKPPRFFFWFAWLAIDFHVSGNPYLVGLYVLVLAFLVNGLINLVEEASK